MANRNRNAGNQAERDIVNELKELGFNVVTSRSESRSMDNKKVDIFSPLGVDPDEVFPYYTQVKFTANNPSYTQLIESMPKDRPSIVIHRKSESYMCKDGKKRHRKTGDYVIMTKEEFYKLISNGRDKDKE